MPKSLLSKYLAEFIGTMLLVCAIVGSGIMATNLTTDVGLQLLINAISTVLTLGLLIYVFAEISGSHFNPAVTLIACAQGKVNIRDCAFYLVAQCGGGVVGAILANSIFNHAAFSHSNHVRTQSNYFLSEIVATAGLLFLVNALTSLGKAHSAPIVIAAWIGSAYFFTSSTSFANPAVTLARSFTNSFSGIALHSVSFFVLAQIVGAVIGTLIAGQLFNPQESEGAKNG